MLVRGAEQKSDPELKAHRLTQNEGRRFILLLLAHWASAGPSLGFSANIDLKSLLYQLRLEDISCLS